MESFLLHNLPRHEVLKLAGGCRAAPAAKLSHNPPRVLRRWGGSSSCAQPGGRGGAPAASPAPQRAQPTWADAHRGGLRDTPGLKRNGPWCGYQKRSPPQGSLTAAPGAARRGTPQAAARAQPGATRLQPTQPPASKDFLKKTYYFIVR